MRDRNLDVDYSTASIAIEVMMRFDIPVIARGTDRARHLVDLSLRNQDLEIPIDGSEGKCGHLRTQRFVDFGRGRMRIGLLDPAPDSIALPGSVPTRSVRDVQGGRSHDRILGIEVTSRQARNENSSDFLIILRS